MEGTIYVSLFAQEDARLVYDHLTYLRLLGRSENTIYARARALHRLGAAVPPLLWRADVPTLYAWRAGLQVSDAAVAAYVGHVREWYAWLVDGGHRTDNPAAVLPVPRLPRRLPRPIASDELAAAIETAPRRVRLCLVLAAWCGLRAKEIALLRREAVLDTTDPPCLIVAHDATKGRRERVVPLHPFPLAELHALPLPRSGWVLGRGDGRPGPNHPWRVSQLANDHLHDQGVAATLHQLRHWFGTETYRVHRDLRVVQELLGHADPQTTAGYAAIARAEVVSTVTALPDLREQITTAGQPRPGHLAAVPS